ncbi:hypothetical protein ABIB73_006348 [Bradyrhizobium sp. F1.4.3]|uniref:hypothetical protein n=1 Tax=Bradyrhizobium sp. F1.4.3 TaxID=3156356 RepID=UPI003391829C
MSSCDGDAPVTLKILRGYGKLLGIPHVAHGTRTVALERVGDCEISMFETLGAGSPEAPLFWMELFDLRFHSSRDSHGCHNMTDAVAAFEDFALQASRLAEVSLCELGEAVG